MESPRPDNYPRLALPISELKPAYDVVVIGSGYGAGVAASRMARAGKSVAVLELGMEWRAGSFPRTLAQCLRQLGISGSRRRWMEDKTRLFQLKLGEGQHAFCAHGLGGGSLINAGVFLKATSDVMEMSAWPEEIREDPLDEYYARASSMLQPTTYPETHLLNKTRHLEECSQILAREYNSSSHGKVKSNFSRTPLTTTFQASRNSTGVAMQANQGSGHESTGLNDGSKNSVPVTYLADAWNWGAEIFCGCEVRYVEKNVKQGYTVYFSWQGKGRDCFREDTEAQLFWVTAKEFCFLGAGALGTTEILLRSRDHGLGLSPMLGRNMSGNGDLLVFGYNGRKDINGIAGSSSKSGPTITSMIDNRQTKNSGSGPGPLEGYIIEDGCIPEPFAPVIQALLVAQTLRHELFSVFYNPWTQFCRTIAALKSLLQGPYVAGGAIQRTSTYLIMSHDSNEITITLKNNRPYLQGIGEGRSKNILRIKDSLERVIKHAGASMGFSYFYGRSQEEVSVHVLGGANMSRDGTGREGVTNHRGQVYTGKGSEVYPGLVCCDASVIPTSLGVNPLATITALAERSVALAAEESGLEIDLETPNGDLDVDSMPRVSHFKDTLEDKCVSTGWQFTEALEGYISVPSVSKFEVSEREGKGSSSAIRMFLTVEIQRRVQGGSRYQGVCTGTVSCRALSRRTMRVMQGAVDFFVPGNGVDSTTLRYKLPLQTVEGEELMLVGTKTISPSSAFSVSRLWKATTVVNVQVSSRGESVGAGVMRIPLSSFQRQIRSFRSTSSTVAALPALLMFLLYFILQISLFFFHPLIPRWFTPAKDHSRVFEAKQPLSTYEISASDGVTVKLELYSQKPDESKPPILFLQGVTGLNPQHTIYTLPFQRTNMVDYFTSHGYSCYVLIPRWSINENTAKDCTVFDSRLDIAAALQHISQKPYIIAHCQGSVALAMGLLDGSIQSSQILGITANSVFITQIFPFWNAVKASSTLLIRLYEFLDGPYFPVSFLNSRKDRNGKKKDILQHALDIILSFYPVPHAREFCTSSTCHRTSFAFGLLWNHQNLSPELHNNIGRFFTGTYTKLLSHVVRTGSRGGCLEYKQAVPAAKLDLECLRGVPILFMSGSENQVFSPESTLRDYELLRREFGEGLYRRFLVEGYGHLDTIVGDRAGEDVFWRVRGHLEGLIYK